MIMYAGRIVEHGSRGEVLQEPLHPYTRALFRCGSLLQTPNDREVGKCRMPTIAGRPPDPSRCYTWLRFRKPLSRSDEHLSYAGPRGDARFQRTYGTLFQIWRLNDWQ